MVTNISAKWGSAAFTEVEMTQVVLPQYTNSLGTIFGGQLLSWIDICSAVAAQRHARGPVVTASFDSVNFKEPVKEGHIIILRSKVNAAFKTSMEVGTMVIAEQPFTGIRKKVAHAYCTFVALDENGRPHHLPELMLNSPEDERRHNAATERRRIRLASITATR